MCHDKMFGLTSTQKPEAVTRLKETPMQIRETAVWGTKFKDKRDWSEKRENVEYERVEGWWKIYSFERFRGLDQRKANARKRGSQGRNPIWLPSCYWNDIRSCLLGRACRSSLTKGFFSCWLKISPKCRDPNQERGEKKVTRWKMEY